MPVVGPPVPEGAVACAGDRIVDVGPAATLAARFPAAPTEDLGDAILVPGLVDAHCHLEWSLLDGVLPPSGFGAWLARLLPLRARLAPEDHRIAARHGALRALRAGTTTLADSGPTGAGAAAMAELGLRGSVHLEAFGTQAGEDARRAAAAVAERVAALDADAGSRVRVGVSPHAPYSVGPGLWRALLEEPALAGRPWATHLAESEDEERAVARGEGPIAEAFAQAGFTPPGRWDGADGETTVARVARGAGLRAGLVAAHCVRLSAGDPATLRAAGVSVAHCPRSNAHLRTGPAPLAALRRAGLALGLGTDSPASGGDYDVRAEARACARAHGGEDLAPAALLWLATIGGAEALGLAGEVGGLAPGWRADLVGLRPARPVGEPHRAALDAGARVELVVASGEVVLSGGRPRAADAEATDARAAEARERLW
jgi:5-methylthioadenosine/S-adenosylhomocysteine deaminase